MRIAIPIRLGAVFENFDGARRLLVVDLDSREENSRLEIPMQEEGAVLRAERLSRLEIQLLICGAISPHMKNAVSTYGIDVVVGAVGRADKVLDTYCKRLQPDVRTAFPASHLRRDGRVVTAAEEMEAPLR
jgi:predicted Fe-Mo cluster-binding NifX family protein